jgi:hypothetical protein
MSALGTTESKDPMFASPKNAPADEPGGNDGLQGGGDEASPDVVEQNSKEINGW